MRSYIKQAKDEKLDWQTALIMDMQTEIKSLLSTAVVLGFSWAVINQRIAKILEDADEIEITELRERSKRSLLLFATVAYRQLQNSLKGVNIKVLQSVARYERSPTQINATSLMTDLERQAWTIEQPLKEFSKDYMKKVRSAFGELAKSDAKDDYGSNVSLRNISEMSVRWERKQEERAKLEEAGEDLVWISAHANCSERCQPYQGKLYSMSGRSGSIDGNRFRPLSVATDVKYMTKLGKTYTNGCISGYNCRHYLIPYRKGNKPIEVPAAVVAKQREINNTQRAMERRVKDLRELAVTMPLPEDKAKARAAAVKAYAEYKAYCEKNKVAYYPSRVQAWQEQAKLRTEEQRKKLYARYFKEKQKQDK